MSPLALTFSTRTTEAVAVGILSAATKGGRHEQADSVGSHSLGDTAPRRRAGQSGTCSGRTERRERAVGAN